MPKNSSARRRRRARRIEAEGGVKYVEALRRGEELAAQAREHAERNSRLRPSKIEIGGVEKYWRHEDAGQLGQDGMADPTAADVVAAAEALLPTVRALQSAKLEPTTVVVPYWQRGRLTQKELNEEFRTTIREVIADLERVREDADIGCIEWATVAAGYYGVRVKLNGLDRITGGPLHDRLESAMDAADVLSMTAEAVHSRGCLLGADRSRRFGWGYSPCDGGEVRVRVRIFGDDTLITVPGCPRHAAEEIVNCDYDVEDGMTGVEVMGGTTADLDTVYDLAEQVRRERDKLQRERHKNPSGGRSVPVPPWHRGQDYW
ncbi:hypothetical protein HGA13_12210 [Nocardia speluncae]|uniref:Uncharacterized protein n=1 Tax=Nocardia speluncae TaxID=419477 RepID=A0A846XGP3_9NOCA|nr:hypothetical protein [Nocardia speluncae]NKY33836.1 hypothetical protein [Nocardia speluncae]